VGEQRFVHFSVEQVAQHAPDVVVLALPNGHAAEYAAAIRAVSPHARVVDMSADFRFHHDWAYGLPEHHRAGLSSARQVALPGCYATGIQLALRPLLHHIKGTPRAFGVSGYSGAGTTPSPKNDPARLADNLMAYQLTQHVHEREVSHHLGRAVRFHPHVAAFFRGISLTLSCDLASPATASQLTEVLHEAYRNEPLVRVQREIPEVRDAAHAHGCTVGGLEVHPSGDAFAVVATLDNLLKGAATQAVQCLNLICGLPELLGVPAVA
jgi:N-acetyl-gamma-glutamyl-phosphate reductase